VLQLLSLPAPASCLAALQLYSNDLMTAMHVRDVPVLILRALGWLLMACFTPYCRADVAQMWPTNLRHKPDNGWTRDHMRSIVNQRVSAIVDVINLFIR
jgi:hypothetical protein